MLIVSKKPNGGYRGRFHEKAKELVKSGTRVGIMYVDTTDSNFKIGHCHACNKDFSIPEFEINQIDHFGECAKCKLPFVFIKI